MPELSKIKDVKLLKRMQDAAEKHLVRINEHISSENDADLVKVLKNKRVFLNQSIKEVKEVLVVK